MQDKACGMIKKEEIVFFCFRQVFRQKNFQIDNKVQSDYSTDLRAVLFMFKKFSGKYFEKFHCFDVSKKKTCLAHCE